MRKLRPVRVEMTEEHIDRSVKCIASEGEGVDGGNCPAALAIYDALPQLDNVDAGHPDISWDHDGVRWCYPTPRKLSLFMDRFDDWISPVSEDSRNRPKPVSFTLFPETLGY